MQPSNEHCQSGQQEYEGHNCRQDRPNGRFTGLFPSEDDEKRLKTSEGVQYQVDEEHEQRPPPILRTAGTSPKLYVLLKTGLDSFCERHIWSLLVRLNLTHHLHVWVHSHPSIASCHRTRSLNNR